ncbi:MAG: hypothetical protein ACKV2O_19625 [Acidimicrobiales bacterium]
MTELDSLSLVPPARFGQILTERRWDDGVNLDRLAGLTGGRFGTHDLADIEAGRRLLNDEDLCLLGEVYGVNVEPGLLPRRTRLIVDGDLIAGVRATRPRSVSDGIEDVLTRYLGLILALRGAPAGTPILLRQEDLAVLSDTLWIEPDEVESRLALLMTNPRDRVGRRARRLARRTVIPEAGIMVAATGEGLLVLDERGDDPGGGLEMGRSGVADVIALNRHDEPVTRSLARSA